jgi:hypothetical protein
LLLFAGAKAASLVVAFYADKALPGKVPSLHRRLSLLRRKLIAEPLHLLTANPHKLGGGPPAQTVIQALSLAALFFGSLCLTRRTQSTDRPERARRNETTAATANTIA